MCMWKRDKKKGVTLIELMIALSVFILLAIPVTNSIIHNTKINKAADEKKDQAMAMNYGYENLKKLVYEGNIKIDENTYNLSIDDKDLEYKGRFTQFSYKYKVKNIKKYTTESNTTGPTEGNNAVETQGNEFNSMIMDIELQLCNKEDNSEVCTEKYTFRTNTSL